MEEKVWTGEEFYRLSIKEQTGYFKFTDGERWYKEGKFHRLDGPAVEYPDGLKYWYIEGKKYTEEEFNIISFAILNNLERFL